MSIERKPLHASDASYQKALAEVYDRLERRVRLVADDDTTPGNKSTHCNIGLCAKDIEKDGVYWDTKKHRCPHDRRAVSEDGTGAGEVLDEGAMASGCFWSCRIFRPKKRDNDTHAKRTARTEALLKKALGL